MASNARKSSQISLREERRFEKKVIKEVVKAVEDGLSRKKACEQYGMSYGTLHEWLQQYGSENYHREKRRDFTPLQKRTIVCAIEQGSMTPQEACIAYRVKGVASVKRWVRESKREKAELCMTTPIMAKPIDPLITPEVAALQQALEDAQLKIAALNTLIDVAEEQLKINIRKKPGAKQSPK